jgi:hypothetical protein
MVKHLTASEKDLIDNTVGKKKQGVTEALAAVNRKRIRCGQDEVTRTPVYRYVSGMTHKRSAMEKRGRKKVLSKKDMKKLDKVRRRLIKDADGDERITYVDVIAKAGLGGKCGQRTAENALRSTGVGFKPPRRKIGLTDEDAKKRLDVGKKWIKRPKGFWTEKVHAYYDCKTFPAPLNPKQRKRYKQTLITGHLRKASEGTEQGFTRPRTEHCWLGCPSVTIAAAVAKDKVIMWHVVGKSWNGAKASAMYKGPLKTALRRTWGPRRQYTIVEDGDRKGNQSGKGITAKREAKLKAIVLPPRSPCWMPLDYSIWQKINVKLLESEPVGNESKASFVLRLKKAAKTLPRGTVAAAIGHMKKQIQGVIDAQGYHPKCD